MYPGLQPRAPTSMLLVVQVAGGIAPFIVDNAVDASANVIVFGSTVLSADNRGDMISLFRSSVDTIAEKRMVCL